MSIQVNAALLGTAPRPAASPSAAYGVTARLPKASARNLDHAKINNFAIEFQGAKSLWLAYTEGLLLEKTTYLENLSYLKVFSNLALQVSISACITYINKHGGKDTADVSSYHYIICMTFVKEPQSFCAGIMVFSMISHHQQRQQLCHTCCDIFELFLRPLAYSSQIMGRITGADADNVRFTGDAVTPFTWPKERPAGTRYS